MLSGGIYCILNKITGEAYVGQSVHFKNRWQSHLQLLKKGKHHAPALQASFDKHGRAAFAFNVLERCQASELDAKEHDWMLRVDARLNVMMPDYSAAIGDRPPDGKLKRRKGYAAVHPSRFTCGCGAMKSLGSRWCLNCARVQVGKMVASGYLTAEPETDRGERIRPESPGVQQLRAARGATHYHDWQGTFAVDPLWIVVLKSFANAPHHAK